MKKILIICVIFLFVQSICIAGDYIVEFVEENYKETQSPSSQSPIIYHTLQVYSEVGPKLLILSGSNPYYRRWLRQYIAKGTAFIVKVSDDQDSLFLKSDSFQTDEKNVYPFNLSLYRQGEEKSRNDPDWDELERLRRRAPGKKDIGSKPILPEAETNTASKAVADQKAKNDQAREEKNRLEAKEMIESLQQSEAEEINKQLEQEKNEQQEFLLQLAEQKSADEARRRHELEKRWQELKKRLLADEKIKRLDQDAQAREIERRWQELKQRFELE